MSKRPRKPEDGSDHHWGLDWLPHLIREVGNPDALTAMVVAVTCVAATVLGGAEPSITFGFGIVVILGYCVVSWLRMRHAERMASHELDAKYAQAEIELIDLEKRRIKIEGTKDRDAIERKSSEEKS